MQHSKAVSVAPQNDPVLRAPHDTSNIQSRRCVNVCGSCRGSPEVAAQRVVPPVLPKALDLAFVKDKPATLNCLAGMLRGNKSYIVRWDWLGGESEGEEDSGITQEQVKQLHAECGLQTVHCGIGFKNMDMSVFLGKAKKT